MVITLPFISNGRAFYFIIVKVPSVLGKVCISWEFMFYSVGSQCVTGPVILKTVSKNKRIGTEIKELKKMLSCV